MSDAADKAIVPDADDGLLPLDEPEVKTNPDTSSKQDFVEQVNATVSQLIEQEDGTWDLPEGDFSPELRYAVVSEKRRRNAQSALDKAQHTVKTTKAEAEALRARLKGKVTLSISAEDQEALDELKYADPDAWRVKMNELEQRAASDTDSELAKVADEVSFNSEIERRSEVLAKFNEENSDSPITDEVIMNDIPPRITAKLKAGTIAFEDFLVEVSTYLKTGKVIVKEEILDQPNLSAIGGSDKAAKSAVDKDIATSYDNEIF